MTANGYRMELKALSVEDVAHSLTRLRARAPLVHNITNHVVMQITANALLAIGASPVMAHEPEEIQEITGLASALVLNIGTLSKAWIASMRMALDVATERAIPVVIDPVGAGASRLRTATALELLANSRQPLLRGNASEIMALAGQAGKTKGVDSTVDSGAAMQAADDLALRFDCVVSVSGETDIVTDGRNCCLLRGGSALMPRVTGMGCSASALAGAFAGVCKGPGEVPPLVAAMAVMAAAGGEAARRASGPGSFTPLFLDALYHMDAAMLARGVDISIRRRTDNTGK